MPPFTGPKTVFIVGPTASGKTALLSRLVQKIPLEVISCDSMQVYQALPILSQSPPPRILKRIPHHLVGVLSCRKEFDVALFCRKAQNLMRAIKRRGHLPFVVGGTGLYAHSLLDGIFAGPGKNEAVRSLLTQYASRKGPPALHEELSRLDPAAARLIHPNDLRRLIRALEVIWLTGELFSELKKKRQGIWNPEEVRIYGLRWEREALYARINERVDHMFRKGALEEAKNVLSGRLSMTASMCLGLKELQSYFENDRTLTETKECLKQHTRQFAKRQIAWFKRDKRIRWLDLKGEAPFESSAAVLLKDLNVKESS